MCPVETLVEDGTDRCDMSPPLLYRCDAVRKGSVVGSRRKRKIERVVLGIPFRRFK